MAPSSVRTSVLICPEIVCRDLFTSATSLGQGFQPDKYQQAENTRAAHEHDDDDDEKIELRFHERLPAREHTSV
jgi:hypothetical protein